MSKGDNWENDILKLLFQATAVANIADNAASSPLTSLYVSLHTASPTDAGNQTSSETSYGGYLRQAVARSGSGWTVTGNSVSPASTITFPQCSSGSATITYAGIGTASSGTGKLLYFGAISPQIAVSVGVSPQLTTSSTIQED